MIHIQCVTISLVGLAVLASTCISLGQDQFRYFAPQKDVALLVDVSVSVRRDRSGHEEAKEIITQLLKGESVAHPDWAIETERKEMADLFSRYLGLPAVEEAAELRPLIGSGNSFLSLPVGELSTVLNGESFRTLRDTSRIPELVGEAYPKRMDDTSTCYWFAMAQAAATLSQRSKLGYYLFVISDEEDDPDYREDGPPGHTMADYQKYQEELADRYPEESIRASIEKFFIPESPTPRNSEQYRPRGSFGQVLIARFYQRGFRESSGRDQKVRIAWYAMGVTPEKVMVPRDPPPVQEGIPQSVAKPSYQPPQLTPILQLLGGLEEGRKVFEYKDPIFVWQVMNMEASQWDPGAKALVKQSNSRLRRGTTVSDSPRKMVKSWQLSDQIDIGIHNFELELEDTAVGASLVREFEIVITNRSGRWLTMLSIASLALALIIFYFSWKKLRQNRVVIAR